MDTDLKRKINFKESNRLIRSMKELHGAFEKMFEDEEGQKNRIRSACEEILMERARESLADVSVDELKNSKAGIRVSALKDAGYENLRQLSSAKDWELTRINGIGEKQLDSIRSIISGFSAHLTNHMSINLSDDALSRENREVISAIAVYRKCSMVREDAGSIRKDLDTLVNDACDRRMIGGRFLWFFSGKDRREYTLRTLDELADFGSSPQFERTGNLLSLYQQHLNLSEEAAEADFRKNSASYYALIEDLMGGGVSKELIYSSVPRQLAAEIDATELCPDCFRGNLRAYQKFGSKYILHQGRVLLGDEMGLGKTIQAIAAMADIYSRKEKCHFLIVCPASVLVNWCREIAKFSSIEAHLIHGQYLMESFESWQERGGAAVTNYESMGRIVDMIDDHMTLAMMIIDEAHYIKNPDAARTKHIHALEDESERIVLMTGTPLENRVEEMIALIDFVRPDMSDSVKRAAYMSRIPEFKELLSPVYLRRQRSQVLEELPPVISELEWCRMTDDDLAFYCEALRQGNFTSVRRVGFLQDDLSGSSKAMRLMELCSQSIDEGRKVVIYSFFRETIQKLKDLLGEMCIGSITGSSPALQRQTTVDSFTDFEGGCVLLCQVQAGGTGLNIQAASVVIFCEPQIKPSFTNQAISRVCRMGQINSVLVYHLLCENSVDEEMMKRLEKKQTEFDTYADESAMGSASEDIVDNHWIQSFLESENKKYLPSVISQNEVANI